MALTKLNNKAVANVTSIPVALGDMVLVSSATASSSASIEFSLGNYKEYKFFFVNMHPQNNGTNFQFNCSTDNGSNYNVVKTTTSFRAYQNEAGTNTSLAYDAGADLAQSTAYQQIMNGVGNDNDQAGSGFLSLYNPSSNIYVKHFMSSCNATEGADYTIQTFYAGYFNDTNDLTNISFKFASGNIDAGKILMFGIN